MSILILPESIFYLIKSFLTRRGNYIQEFHCLSDREMEIEYEDYKTPSKNSWHTFLNTTQQLRQLKYKSLDIILTDKYVKKYVETEEFRNQIHSLISNKKKQLNFIIQHDHRKILQDNNNYNYFNDCHFLQLKFRNINLNYNNFFYNIEILSLFGCKGIKELTNFPILKILDVNELSDLETISNLSSLQQLYIIDCKRFASVTNVPQLTLIAMDKDFLYPINQIKHLVIHSKMNKLLPYPENYVSLICFHSIIMNFPSLLHLKELHLNSIPSLHKIEHLLNVEILHIYQCNQLYEIDFSTLLKLKKLFIVECNALRTMIVNCSSSINSIQMIRNPLLTLVDLQTKVGSLSIQTYSLSLQITVRQHIKYPCQRIHTSGKVFFQFSQEDI